MGIRGVFYHDCPVYDNTTAKFECQMQADGSFTFVVVRKCLEKSKCPKKLDASSALASLKTKIDLTDSHVKEGKYRANCPNDEEDFNFECQMQADGSFAWV